MRRHCRTRSVVHSQHHSRAIPLAALEYPLLTPCCRDEGCGVNGPPGRPNHVSATRGSRPPIPLMDRSKRLTAGRFAHGTNASAERITAFCIMLRSKTKLEYGDQ